MFGRRYRIPTCEPVEVTSLAKKRVKALHQPSWYSVRESNSRNRYVKPTVCHYLSETHCLEVRTTFPQETWEKLKDGFPNEVIFVGLSSIYWREAWKYGERAFRYCHHDIGHAIASLSIASAELGWEARLIENLNSAEMQTLLGLKKVNHAEEIEDANCLIAIFKKR